MDNSKGGSSARQSRRLQQMKFPKTSYTHPQNIDDRKLFHIYANGIISTGDNYQKGFRSFAKVSAMHLEKNKYGTQKMLLSQRSLVAEVGKAVKVRDFYSQSGTYGGAKPAKFARSLNY
ncbi:hypothetical protein POM88_031297 [Heracleum sosnowskyi]|uniref:Uncharacterized protein n=1 Tax=Heracleum sosnowskyi TaxID=360622 RepID=A0AAD8HYD2_9APIA|nr:hypothetical protein POM88_031297 [Heracleum sosnowskyi]